MARSSGPPSLEKEPKDLVHIDLDAIASIARVAEDSTQRLALGYLLDQLVGDSEVKAGS